MRPTRYSTLRFGLIEIHQASPVGCCAVYQSFNVQASDLARSTGMRLVGFGSSTQEVVINIVGNQTATFSNFFVDVGSVPLTSIIWNVCEANLVVIQGFQFPGTSPPHTHAHTPHGTG